MRKLWIVLVLALLFPFVSIAQANVEKLESIKVYFRQGSGNLELDYMGNEASLEQLADLLKPYLIDVTKDNAKGEGRVHISSSISPEGSSAINKHLVDKRAKVIADWITEKFNVKIGYVVESMGVDWGALVKFVDASAEVPNREQVRTILNDTTIDREAALKRLDGGVSYRYLYNKIYPTLRYAAASTEIWYATDIDITSESPLNFTAEGGNGTITFTKDINDFVVPTASCDADWITDIVATSNDLTFKVAPNGVAVPRSSVITLVCYNKHHQVVVNQEAAKIVFDTTSENPAYVGANAGRDTITYRTNQPDVRPTASCDADWISDIVVDNGKIFYNYATNKVSEPRSAVMRLECFDKSNEVIVHQSAAEPKPECARPFYMSLSTNMLYDVLAVPNIRAEFYVGKNFSVGADWMYGWWNNDSRPFYWRIYGGQVFARYWLGKAAHNKPLTGHHIGLYGQIFTYDFLVGGHGYMGGVPGGTLWDKMNYAAGVEYGYSLPIARRLNIDFTLGLGWMGGVHYEYIPLDGHYVWQSTKRQNWIGPTKLEVSLVWLIGCSNYNKKKGGKR